MIISIPSALVFIGCWIYLADFWLDVLELKLFAISKWQSNINVDKNLVDDNLINFDDKVDL